MRDYNDFFNEYMWEQERQERLERLEGDPDTWDRQWDELIEERIQEENKCRQ